MDVASSLKKEMIEYQGQSKLLGSFARSFNMGDSDTFHHLVNKTRKNYSIIAAEISLLMNLGILSLL
jgi:hypothetical protein